MFDKVPYEPFVLRTPFTHIVRKWEGVHIPLLGNISLCLNLVCILFISSERNEVFQLGFAALIQVSIETF